MAAVRLAGLSLRLALSAFGVSMVGYAVELRVAGAPRFDWFAWGTAGLVSLNSGVACFGEAVKHRVLGELGRAPSRRQA